MSITHKLHDLGYELPQAASAYASYVPYVISGSQLFIAGQIPFLNGQEMNQGILGKDLDVAAGQEAARACALNILAQVNAAVDGDWDRVERCIKLGAFVACTPDFTAHPAVANGASELLVAVLGDAGRHVRAAVGVPSLPLNAAVEIDAVFALK